MTHESVETTPKIAELSPSFKAAIGTYLEGVESRNALNPDVAVREVWIVGDPSMISIIPDVDPMDAEDLETKALTAAGEIEGRFPAITVGRKQAILDSIEGLKANDTIEKFNLHTFKIRK